MRKPQLNEVIIIGYGSYVWFTLSFDPDFFYRAIADNPESMYAAYIGFLGTQQNLAIFSLVLALVTIAVLFTERYSLRIISALVGLVYFTILAASYIFSYPNLGLGLSALMLGVLIFNINRLIDEKEEAKKRKLLCDNYKSEGGDNE